MSAAVVTEPRVWIGCLACYNSGQLVGHWYPATEAGDVDLDSIRANAWDEGLREGLDRGWDQAAGAVPDGTPAPKNPYRKDDA